VFTPLRHTPAVPDETARAVMTFIVRIARDPTGRLHGTVERVRTGEKERFTGADAVGGVIEQMLGRDEDRRRR
jgi:hypothetical protein